MSLGDHRIGDLRLPGGRGSDVAELRRIAILVALDAATKETRSPCLALSGTRCVPVETLCAPFADRPVFALSGG